MGGAVYMARDSRVENSDFNKNVAILQGGAIYFSPTFFSAHISDSNFYNNRAQGGGAIYALKYWPFRILRGLKIIENLAVTGGGIYITFSDYDYFEGSGELITDTLIQANHAYQGGGVAVATGGMSGWELRNTVLKDNVAILEGGGLFVEGSLSFTNNAYFLNNVANNSQSIESNYICKPLQPNVETGCSYYWCDVPPNSTCDMCFQVSGVVNAACSQYEDAHVTKVRCRYADTDPWFSQNNKCSQGTGCLIQKINGRYERHCGVYKKSMNWLYILLGVLVGVVLLVIVMILWAKKQVDYEVVQ
eukprot:TRINITY_DN3045_c0_g2_i1.p1 TRINITY_DN3045_c0_g2~~TRINITY_DN3045_c0_g2_i1.p1  ORF type:complete len:304 (-),score=40.55 TRINITY_DN3045_c0_g2_i1:57-968(-)